MPLSPQPFLISLVTSLWGRQPHDANQLLRLTQPRYCARSSTQCDKCEDAWPELCPPPPTAMSQSTITLYDIQSTIPQPWAPNIWRIRYAILRLYTLHPHTENPLD